MTKTRFFRVGLVAFLAWMAPLMVYPNSLNAQGVVGIWRSSVGICSGETILKPDGTFSKTSRCGGLFTWDVGTYTVGQGYIHFTIQDHEPKVYKGRAVHWVTSETVFFSFSEPDRMICEDRVIGTRWEAYRVR